MKGGPHRCCCGLMPVRVGENKIQTGAAIIAFADTLLFGVTVLAVSQKLIFAGKYSLFEESQSGMGYTTGKNCTDECSKPPMDTEREQNRTFTRLSMLALIGFLAIALISLFCFWISLLFSIGACILPRLAFQLATVTTLIFSLFAVGLGYCIYLKWSVDDHYFGYSYFVDFRQSSAKFKLLSVVAAILVSAVYSLISVWISSILLSSYRSIVSRKQRLLMANGTRLTLSSVGTSTTNTVTGPNIHSPVMLGTLNQDEDEHETALKSTLIPLNTFVESRKQYPSLYFNEDSDA